MPSLPMYRARTLLCRSCLWSGLAVLLWICAQGSGGAQTLPAPRPAAQVSHAQRIARTQRFLGGRALAASGARSQTGAAARALAAARVEHLALLAQPRTSNLSLPWTAVGPAEVASAAFGNVTGRVTAIAIDPADASGNTVYAGTTGGGVWKSTNAAGPPAQVSFSPLTDTLPVFSLNAGASALPSLSIGAVAVANGVVLAGTGDPNDATDSYYGAGILRSADGGATWTLAQNSLDGVTGNHSFFGLSVAGFAFSSLNPSLAVAAVSQAAQAALVNAANANYSEMGLYFSTDAGTTWHMATLSDGAQVVQSPQPGGSNNGGNAVTAVVWNPLRQRFLAAVRFHGYYESTDGATWTRLAQQPGAGLTTSACPANPNTSGSTSCPIFRGALAVEPSTSDTFALTVDGSNHDQGLYQDVCAAAAGGCAGAEPVFGVQLNAAPLESSGRTILQGDYNLALAAAPLGTDSVLYVGTIDLYRCSLAAGCALRNTSNAENGCLNTAQVAPAQHAIAALGGAGTGQSGGQQGPLVFLGNDGGLNRSTDGVAESGPVCSAGDASHFDNLNAAFGAAGGLSEVVSFAQDPADPGALLTGLGALGTAGTATDAGAWTQLATGEGGTVAIDPVTPANWYLSSAAGVSLARCTRGSACQPGDFSTVIGEVQVANDIAAIHAPYLLDPQLTSNVLVGTCRAWRGPANGVGWPGPYLLSRPFGAPAATACSSTFPVVRALGAGGPVSTTGAIENRGSKVLYAGLAGRLDGGGQGLGGHLFVTTSADTADGTSVWTDAAHGTVINDLGSNGIFNVGGFDVSAVVPDLHDASGQTVYATVMGFTGNGINAPHLYRSTDAGGHWTNISSNLPNAPANSVVIDPNDANTVYVALDTGVYATSAVTGCASTNCWTVLGSGLPNAPAVELTASAALPTGDGRLGELRVGTYGRGIWQIPLLTASAPARASIALSPASVDFGSHQVGAAASYVTIMATNSGSAPLHVTSVVTNGDYVSSDTCVGSTVAQGASCTVQVGFVPSATGQRNGLLTLYADVTGGQATEALTGVGTAPASVVLTPGSLSFPATSLGSSSAVENITVANTGGSTTQLQHISSSAEFLISANTCGPSLAPQTSCTVGLVFAPAAAGARNGTLTVVDDAGTQVAALTGTGTRPATDALSPLALSFSPQPLQTLSPGQPVTLTNAGDVALTLIAAQVTSGDFTVVNNCGNSLNPHSSCTLMVAFVPNRLGSQTGVLEVGDQFRAQAVALSGVGVAPPGVSLSPANGLSFGAAGLGVTSPPQTLTLTNNGGIPLAVAAVSVTGEFAVIAGSNTCTGSLAPTAVCTVAIAFAPATTGPHTGSVTFSDDAGSSPQHVAVTGTGVDFSLGADGPVSLTVASGGSVTYGLLLDSSSGVTGNASFTCAGVPQYAACTVNPNVVALGGGNTLVTVTVATGEAAAASAVWVPGPGPDADPRTPRNLPPAAWALVSLPLGWTFRRRRRLPLRLLGLALVFVALAGCSVSRTLPGNGTADGSTSVVTPAGTYTINVAASSAGLVRAQSLTLVVQ